MNDNNNFESSEAAFTDRLAAPYEELDQAIKSIERLHASTLSDQERITFQQMPRSKRLRKIHARFTQEWQAEEATAADNSVELVIDPHTGLSVVQNKLANLLAMERSLRIADFVMTNDLAQHDFTSLVLSDKVSREAGRRLVGHVIRIGKRLGREPADSALPNFDELIERAKNPRGDHYVATLGSVIVEASALVGGLINAGVENIFALHYYHDPDLFTDGPSN